MSKPHIANAILQSDEEKQREEDRHQQDQRTPDEHNIKRLNNYLKTISIDRYPPVIQQAVRDIRYISETQREAQKDDLVREKRRFVAQLTLLLLLLGARGLAIHCSRHRSLFSDHLHYFDCHWFVHHFTLSAVHT